MAGSLTPIVIFASLGHFMRREARSSYEIARSVTANTFIGTYLCCCSRVASSSCSCCTWPFNCLLFVFNISSSLAKAAALIWCSCAFETFQGSKPFNVLNEICNPFWMTVRGVARGGQPKTRKLQQVCCRLVTLLSSSRYQDAFASLAPASWKQVCCKLSTGLMQDDNWDFLSPSLMQVAPSLQISSWNKSYFHRLAASWWIQQTCCNFWQLAGSR